MATMQTLFFCVLFVCLCFFVGFGQHPVAYGQSVETHARARILEIASGELGVREATGKNDGERVELYLAYTNLTKGQEWCAAFVSWCYGRAGHNAPRNPWSPALFPKARTTYVTIQAKEEANALAQPADLFGIYGVKAKRINHVGLVKAIAGDYVLTIEGNSSNRVQSLRRHIRTVYAFANWLKP